MIQGEQPGFTIVETMLFLAVSSLLLLIAVSFTAGTLSNTRFNDATKSLQTFLQEQYTRVQTNSLALNTPLTETVPVCQASGPVTTATSTGTVNTTGSSNTCILLGSALDISTDKRHITIHPILGYQGKSTATLAEANPRIWSGSEETYELLWQSELVAAKAYKIATPGEANVKRLIFLRDTTSERINFYATTGSDSSLLGIDENDFIDTPSNARNIPTLLCIKSGDGGSLRGGIRVNGSGTEQSTGIDTIAGSVVSQGEKFFAGVYSGAEGLACND